MSTVSSFVASASLAAESGETLRELPMPPAAFGIIAWVVMILLLGVVWMFRHAARAYLDGHAPTAQGHGDAHHGNADRHDPREGAGH